MLLDTLGSSLLGNLFTGIGKIRTDEDIILTSHHLRNFEIQ